MCLILMLMRRVGGLVAAAATAYAIMGGICAGEFESSVTKGREEKPRDVVKCSPSGDNGCFSPLDALAKLKKGNLLRFAPGKYPDLLVECDNVVIEGEPGAFCTANVRVKGKNCVVRNLWVRKLRAEQDIVIVDSMVMELELSNEQALTPKTRFQVFNTACHSVRLLGANGVWAVLDMRNCVVECFNESAADVWNAGFYMSPNTDASLSKCILYSKDTVFGFGASDTESKDPKLTLKDCLVYGEGLLGKKIVVKQAVSGQQKKNELTTRDAKGFQKMCKFLASGKLEVRKPDFASFEIKPIPSPTGVGNVMEEQFFLTQENIVLLKNNAPFKDLDWGIKPESMKIQFAPTGKTLPQPAQAEGGGEGKKQDDGGAVKNNPLSILESADPAAK